MIRRPEEVQNDGKKIRMLIAGYPGLGKTTLALSAPSPLLIDVDFGIDRAEARVRTPYIQPTDYQEILDDLKDPAGLKEFETLVFDTGGRLISLMSRWAIAQNPKNGQNDGSLSLKGYGAVGREFNRLMDHCFYNLKKNIIVVFHAVEEKDGDNTRLRIKCEGQTKNNVWEPMDLGGFMEMQGRNRVIGFSNCEKYFAKGTKGIQGTMVIPDISHGAANNFLTKLFEQYNENLRAESAELAEIRTRYAAAMKKGTEILGNVTDAVSANTFMDDFKQIEHAMTSERELGTMWNRKIKELGLNFDREKKAYV